MLARITPSPLKGTVPAIASKSISAPSSSVSSIVGAA